MPKLEARRHERLCRMVVPLGQVQRDERPGLRGALHPSAPRTGQLLVWLLGVHQQRAPISPGRAAKPPDRQQPGAKLTEPAQNLAPEQQASSPVGDAPPQGGLLA